MTGEAVRALLGRPNLARLLAALDGAGEETRVVGGAVRDTLLARPVGEIDLATTALPAETSRRAARAGFKTIPTGLRHGTVTVLVDGEPFEVTTLREDVDTDGRHAVVRFGRDFEADAGRRDFTVNGLSVGPDGRVHDTVGGLADLVAGRVRFIGEPARRVREDYLRILRFFRFSAGYASGELDRDGLEAAIAGRDGLARLSPERVRAEMLKLVAAPRAAATLDALQAAGLLGRLVTNVAESGRLARAVAAGLSPIARLAAALVRTREDAERLTTELRLSNAEAASLSAYADALAGEISRSEMDAAEMRRQVARRGLGPVTEVAATTAGEPGRTWSEEAHLLLADYSGGRREPPRFRLTGQDLLREGVPAGPEIGRRLGEARTAWIAAGCPDR